MRKPSLHKRMYAVSLERVGIIAGTMAYSRKAAIELFTPLQKWEQYKRAGSVPNRLAGARINHEGDAV